MKLRGIVEEDFLQYKKPSMFLIFPFCTFKCDKENGNQICQNSSLVNEKIIEIENEVIINHYLNNPITKAITCGGLEPFESFDELYSLVEDFREKTEDPIIIYTGFRNEEIREKINSLSKFKNIIIKFGRYIPGQQKHFDQVLGVELASLNQYAVKIS